MIILIINLNRLHFFLFFNKVLELPVLNRTFLGSQKEPKAENLRESFLNQCGSNKL